MVMVADIPIDEIAGVPALRTRGAARPTLETPPIIYLSGPVARRRERLSRWRGLTPRALAYMRGQIAVYEKLGLPDKAAEVAWDLSEMARVGGRLNIVFDLPAQ